MESVARWTRAFRGSGETTVDSFRSSAVREHEEFRSGWHEIRCDQFRQMSKGFFLTISVLAD